jgi:hypothetical protein
MATARLTITIKGATRDKGKVRLDALIAKLVAVQRALSAIEESLPSHESHGDVYLRIQKITYSSPLSMIIDVTTAKKDGTYTRSLVGTFKTDLEGLTSGSGSAANTPYARLDAYRELAESGLSKSESAAIRAGRKTFLIDAQFKETIDSILSDATAEEREHGSVTGRLDVINLHGKKQFYIYPSLGPTRIKCMFEEDLREAVKKAIDQKVQVSGILRYRKHDSHPFAVEAKRIEPLLEDVELPTFESLRGIAPDITEGMNAADYIRKIRDEEW